MKGTFTRERPRNTVGRADYTANLLECHPFYSRVLYKCETLVIDLFCEPGGLRPPECYRPVKNKGHDWMPYRGVRQHG